MLSTSCHRCYIRKIRCDRSTPCAACDKVGAECRPAVNTRTRPSLRKKYGDDAKVRELQVQLQRYEAWLRNHGFDAATLDTTEDTPPDARDESQSPNVAGGSTTNTRFENVRSASPVELHPTMRLYALLEMIAGRFDGDPAEFNNDCLTRVVNIFDRRHSKESSTWIFTPPDIATPPRHPEPFQVFQLWNIYRKEILPYSRLLCEASIDELIYRCGPHLNDSDAESTDASPSFPGPSDHALLFAIYQAAISSMNPQTSRSMFGDRHTEILETYKQGTQYWVFKSNILRSVELCAIQGLVIFLGCIDRDVDPRSMMPILALAKSLVKRVLALTARINSGDSPLQVDLIKRLWWELVAVEDRNAWRGGNLGFQPLDDDGALSIPTPSCSGDPDLANTHSARKESVDPGKIIPSVRNAILEFVIQTRLSQGFMTGQIEFAGCHTPLDSKLRRIDEFGERLRRRYLFGPEDRYAGTHAAKCAEVMLSTRILDWRLTAHLTEEMSTASTDSALESHRRLTLEVCIAACKNFLSIHDDPTLRHPYITSQSWVIAILHLFRLTRFLVTTDAGLVQQTWDFVDANYDRALGGIKLRRDPTRPGTLDAAMLGAWDDLAQRASKDGISMEEPHCVRQARRRIANEGDSIFVELDNTPSTSTSNVRSTQTSTFGDQDAPSAGDLFAGDDWYGTVDPRWAFWPDQL